MKMVTDQEKVALIREIVEIILDSVNLKNVDLELITSETPLVNGILGLDSVDILEVIVAIEHHFGIKLSNADEGRKYFQSIGTIADFVIEKRS